MSDQLIQQISKAIIDGNKETAMATANEAIKTGIDLEAFIKQGMTPAMQAVGEKFENFEYFLADIIKEAVNSLGGSDDFVGHIGGDDFVLITSVERGEFIARHIIDEFDNGSLIC